MREERNGMDRRRGNMGKEKGERARRREGGREGGGSYVLYHIMI